jgi:hypothetical protein
MCRNIKPFFNFDPPVSDEEARARNAQRFPVTRQEKNWTTNDTKGAKKSTKGKSLFV